MEVARPNPRDHLSGLCQASDCLSVEIEIRAQVGDHPHRPERPSCREVERTAAGFGREDPPRQSFSPNLTILALAIAPIQARELTGEVVAASFAAEKY
jgi:hypothetical protein